jgi:competence protein CoiA
MRLAVVEGKLREAQPGCSAECPDCGRAMIARCGQYRVPHWAHRGICTGDPWWEPETEWHRAWKNHFPGDWQEIIHRSKDGEQHRADVKTDSGVVLEFQHSLLCRDERESREIFYQNMVWVVDGRRRLRDRARFFASLGEATVVNPRPLTFWSHRMRAHFCGTGERAGYRCSSTSGISVNRVIRYASIRPFCGDSVPVARTAGRIYRQC